MVQHLLCISHNITLDTHFIFDVLSVLTIFNLRNEILSKRMTTYNHQQKTLRLAKERKEGV